MSEQPSPEEGMKRTPLKRKTPLRRVSNKREAIIRSRRKFVREQLIKRPWCEAGQIIGSATGQWAMIGGIRIWSYCKRVSTELHEPLTRARMPGPDTILDETNSVSLCRRCHFWIHENPKCAESIGLLRHSWEGDGL
jgi:hypothetical protein